LRGNSVLF